MTMPESGPWPLIGRAQELQLIADAVNGSDGSAGVAISGASGVGKSRLAREAVARSGHGSVRWAAGSSAARGLPLGAFVEWLPDEVSDLADRAGKLIAALGGHDSRRPAVVGVDDAHLLDDMSAFVLDQLVRRRLARVVLTMRSGAPVPDAVAALWRDGHLRRLELQPLSHTDCAQLLDTVLGGPLDPISERRLWRLTRGNVQFMRHIVEHERNVGRIRRTENSWTWLPGYVVSSTVCELIEHEIGELPEAVADVVDLLAVAEPLAVSMLIQLVGAGPTEDAEKRGLIVVHGGDEPVIRLAHPLYGEVRRARAGLVRLRRLRGMVASRLDSGISTDPRHIVRRGALILDSDIETSGPEMVRAAEAALWRGDSALASRFARAAMSAGGGWQATLAYAEALSMSGEMHEAHSFLANLVITDLPCAGIVQLTLARAQNLYLQGRVDAALEALEAGKPAASSTGSAVATFDAMRAFLAACGGDFTLATSAADAALSCAGLAEPPAMLAAIAKVIAMGEQGDTNNLETTVTRAAVLGERFPATSFLRFALAEAHTSALQLLGFHAAAQATIDRLRDDDLPSSTHDWLGMMTGAACTASGHIDGAIGRMRSATSQPSRTFLGGWLHRYQIDLAIALAGRGESDAAEQCLNRMAIAPRPTTKFLEPMEMLARAWISASVGAVSRAIAETRRAAARAAAGGQLAREVLCLQTATRFGDTTTVARLAELAGVVGGPRAPTTAAHASALAAGDGDELTTVSERYEAMGDLMSAADAAAQASVAVRSADRRGSALGATARCRRIAELCAGPVRTPAIAACAAPPMFTGREREIITLAGGGLTNREIAERLQLSIRTVESHLYRAAGRVGARDRRELARTICDAALGGRVSTVA
jgi:DNA-binding NarL/FixJ family response regulator